MSIQVRYYSRGGNTEKLAQAAAQALAAQAKPISEGLSERAEILFLGASVYAGKCDKSVIEFIRQNKENIGTLVLFGSSASGRSAFASVKAAAQDAGVKVNESFFTCPGAFMFLHKNRPNDKDLAAVRAFVKARAEEAAV